MFKTFSSVAVRRGHTALYVRTPRLLAELALSRGDGRYVRRLGQLARIGLLVLDDFLRAPRGAVIPRGLRDPPLAAAAAGRSWGQSAMGVAMVGGSSPDNVPGRRHNQTS